MEARLPLAIDFPFQNPGQILDVNRNLDVTSLDALIVINFLARIDAKDQLPEINQGNMFPDVDGNGVVTSRDALLIVNHLSPDHPPLLSARIAHDSAPGGENSDFVTNQYDLEFGLSRGKGSETLELRIDGSASDPFVELPEGFEGKTLLLDEPTIDQIASLPLGDGDHLVEFRVAEQTVTEAFTFTIDKTSPEVTLVGAPTLEHGTNELTVEFSEALNVPTLPVEAIALINTGSGESITVLEVIAENQGQSRLVLGSELSEGSYELAINGLFTDAAGNPLLNEQIAFSVTDKVALSAFGQTSAGLRVGAGEKPNAYSESDGAAALTDSEAKSSGKEASYTDVAFKRIDDAERTDAIDKVVGDIADDASPIDDATLSLLAQKK